MHLTGNMEAFIWGIDGKKFSESGPQPMVRIGEQVRVTLINDTMMEHPSICMASSWNSRTARDGKSAS